MGARGRLLVCSVAVVLGMGVLVLLGGPFRSTESSESKVGSDRNSGGAVASVRQPVIVELFTSEGCSSCPPADALLKKLSEKQPLEGIEILALEEHVDYWNTLGWTDPFSSVDFSRRQEQYAVTLPDGGVYTPQTIVDGAAQFVGNRTRETWDQIRWAAAHGKARLVMTPRDSTKNSRIRTFEVRVEPTAGALPAGNLELWVAVTEKDLTTKVTAGENSGELLQHAPVVRLLRKEKAVGLPTVVSVDVVEKWNPGNLTAIAFVVDGKSKRVEAAGALGF